MKTLILSVLLASFSLPTFAQDSKEQELQTAVATSAPAAAAPKWKASATSYYYDFEGREAGRNEQFGELYHFDDTTLKMQMLSVQYQYSPKWTFLMTASYLENYTETYMPGLGLFKDESRGFGDTYLQAITPVYAGVEGLILADVGVSLPTGRIDIKNPNMATEAHYPYNMQMGSGTYDFLTGVTGMAFKGPFQLGGRFTGIFRNGHNAEGYSLGNLYRTDAWVDYNTSFGLVPRIVAYYKHKDPVRGQNEKYGREGNAWVDFYHHNQINWDVSAALKYQHQLGPVALAAEAGVPLDQGSQNQDDVELETEYYGSLTVSGTF